MLVLEKHGLRNGLESMEMIIQPLDAASEELALLPLGEGFGVRVLLDDEVTSLYCYTGVVTLS